MIYTAYYRVLEASSIKISDDLEKLKKEWCFGMVIFETPGLTYDQLRSRFLDKPELGTVIKWLKENYKEIYKQGVLVS